MSSLDKSFSDTEKTVLLAEIIKFGDVPPAALIQIIREYHVTPRWGDIARPQGRSLQDCRQVYDEMLGQPSGLGISPNIRWDPSASLRGPYGSMSAASSSSNTYTPIQPRPTELPWPATGPYDMRPPEQQKRKRGRPSNAENERRRQEALARGQPWPPPGKKKKTSTSKQNTPNREGQARAPVGSASGTPTTQKAAEESPVLSSSARKRGRLSMEHEPGPEMAPMQSSYTTSGYHPHAQYQPAPMHISSWPPPPPPGHHMQHPHPPPNLGPPRPGGDAMEH